MKRWGRAGPLIGCYGYPECKFTRPLPGEGDEVLRCRAGRGERSIRPRRAGEERLRPASAERERSGDDRLAVVEGHERRITVMPRSMAPVA